MQTKESKTKWHFYISIIKSGVRFGACWALWDSSLGSAAILFAGAEILGILEEI
jgi:hypothetical protein